MKTKILTLMMSGLVLAACNGQPSGDNAAKPAAQPASAPAPQAAETPQATELKSKDGKVVIATSAAFSDKMGDAALLPENVKAEEVLLLQHDADKNITIYALQSGEVADTKAYFDKLAQAINGDKALKNAKVEPAENKLTYHFSHADESGETTLNESCVVEVQDKKVYNVCATSDNADLGALDELMGKVSLAK